MLDLKCYRCAKDIAAEHKICPHCKAKINVLHKILHKIENNRLYLIILVLISVSLLGIAWYLRMETGYKWIIYVVIIMLAPLVPWILKIAYKIADPINEDEKNKGKQ